MANFFQLLIFVLLSIFALPALAEESENGLPSNGTDPSGKFEIHTKDPVKRERLLDRPRLYLDIEKIEMIKMKRDEYPYSRFWMVVREKSKQFVREQPPATTAGIDEANLWKLGDGLPYLALSYRVTGHPLYLEAARKWMDAICGYRDWAGNKDSGAASLLFSMSVAYDWLHDEFTPEELTRYREKISRHAGIFYESLVEKDMWWARLEYHMQNHNYTNVMAMAVAGLALRGENQEAELWLTAAKSNFETVLELLSPDGASHEGIGYWGVGLDSLLKYFLASPAMQGETDIENSPFFRNTAHFRLYASLPDYKEVVDFADSARYEWIGPGHMLRALASVFKDGHSQWLAERIENARKKDAYFSWLDLIWYDETVAPVPPDDLPTYAYFENLGIFISRSNWTEKAVWSFFKAGPSQGKLAESKEIYTGSHIHPDEGSFLLWARGDWLVIDDGYVLKKRTENHNVLTFNGKGQLGEGQRWFDLYPVKQHKGTANIIFKDLQKDYQYLTAELAGMYPPDAGVKSWKRTFIVMPRGRFIVRDDITWDRPGEVVNRVHFGRKPQQSSKIAACFDIPGGLFVEAVLPEGSNFKIENINIGMNEHQRSANVDGGVLLIEGSRTETFLLALDADGRGCGEVDYDLETSASGGVLQFIGLSESVTIDFGNNDISVRPQ